MIMISFAFTAIFFNSLIPVSLFAYSLFYDRLEKSFGIALHRQCLFHFLQIFRAILRI